MNRRGFLGLFGAGVAAGPKLAAGIAQEVAAGVPMAPVGGFASGAIPSTSDSSWRLRQIAKLKTIIRGKDPEAEQHHKMHRLYMAENSERVRLDSLRSVSASHKMRMLVEGNHARQKRIRRTDAMFSLADLLQRED